MKKKRKTYDVWVRRDHLFSAKIEAETLEEAVQKAKSMSIDELIDAPGETIDDEHKLTAVME